MRVRASFFLVCILIAAGASAGWTTPVPLAPDAVPALVSGGTANVGTDGDSYLLVTTDDRGSRAVRMDGEGQVADPNGIGLGEGTWLNSIAGNGSEWLITNANGA